MVGSDISPIVTTVAPTMPVLAAISIPTTTTPRANPPRTPPSRLEMASRSFSAICVFSNITPMKMNNGTATSVWLAMMPNIRPGKNPKSLGLKVPATIPMSANASATPASVKATE